MLDLWQANEDQLARRRPGPRHDREPAAVHRVPGGPFFSYRRRRGDGRLVALAAIPAARARARIGHRMDDRDIRAESRARPGGHRRAPARAPAARAEVLLIAVSKTVDAERIRAAVAAGAAALGENRVQEAKDKIAALGRPVPVASHRASADQQGARRRHALRLDPLGGSARAGAGAGPAGARHRPHGERAAPGEPRRRAAEGRGGAGRGEGAARRAARPRRISRSARSHGHPAAACRIPRRRGRIFAGCASCATRRARASLDGHERGLRRGHRGGRDHGAGGHRASSAAAAPSERSAREHQGQAGRLPRLRQHGRGHDPGHAPGRARAQGCHRAPRTPSRAPGPHHGAVRHPRRGRQSRRSCASPT